MRRSTFPGKFIDGFCVYGFVFAVRPPAPASLMVVCDGGSDASVAVNLCRLSELKCELESLSHV